MGVIFVKVITFTPATHCRDIYFRDLWSNAPCYLER
ncbi:hypothetical protein V12B01_13240 [Vibrio splendidus 12B01]|nr:hypothetical protein V12B01_13240 [Vibrio splendidus 12B01]